MQYDSIILYTDGGARGNPGPAGIGVVIRSDGQIVSRLKAAIGEATNNIAEYEAVILGLEEAKRLGAQEVDVRLDSELVASQLKREFKVKDPELGKRFVRAWNLMQGFRGVRFHAIPREENREADRLVNEAIDEAQRGRG